MRELKGRIGENHEIRTYSKNKISEKRGPILKTLRHLPYFNLIMDFVEPAIYFDRKFKDYNPDLIFTQHEMSFLSSFQDSHQILLLHDFFLLGKPENAGNMSEGSLLIRALHLLRRKFFLDLIYRKTDLVLANSRFVSDKHENSWDREISVVYPLIDFPKYKTDPEGSKILHINPREYKGVDITLRAAESLPERDFILAGNTPSENAKSRIQELDNVEYVGFLDSITEAYRESSVVVAPSTWDEPFGRVPIEAGISGIPCISSGKGGLSESTLPELIVEENEPEEYVEKIRDVEENRGEYSDAVIEHCEKFRPEKQLEKLESLLDEELGIEEKIFR